jgi:hypothetical protein
VENAAGDAMWACFMVAKFGFWPAPSNAAIGMPAERLYSSRRGTSSWIGIVMDRNSEKHLRELLDAAVTQFGPRCLWNIRPELTPASMRVVVRQLKTYGNLAAWRVGAEIEAELASPDSIAGIGQQTISAAPGGAWPSGPDIDHFVIERMIDSYGHNGQKLWAAEPTRPAADL